MQAIAVTYRRELCGVWTVLLSTGEPLTGGEAGPAEARSAVRRHTIGAEVAVARIDRCWS